MKPALTLPLVLVLSGCMELKLGVLRVNLNIEECAQTVHVAKGGGGKVTVSILELTGTPITDEELAQERKTFEPSLWSPTGDATRLGLKNVSTSVERVEGDKIRQTYSGDLPDVFSVFKLLESGVPFQLRKDLSFKILWDGDVLEMGVTNHHEGLDDGDSETENTEREAELGVLKKAMIVVTTDGEFVSASLGEISEDGKKLTIDAIEEFRREIPDSIQFKIRGLAAE